MRKRAVGAVGVASLPHHQSTTTKIFDYLFKVLTDTYDTYLGTVVVRVVV